MRNGMDRWWANEELYLRCIREWLKEGNDNIGPWWSGERWYTPAQRIVMALCLRITLNDEGLVRFNSSKESDGCLSTYGIKVAPEGYWYALQRYNERVGR